VSRQEAQSAGDPEQPARGAAGQESSVAGRAPGATGADTGVETGVDTGAGPGGQPSEAELRAAYEAELSRITSADMVLQAAVSLLNIGARRLGLVGGDPNDPQQGDGRDLEQVRDAIDAVRGLMPVIERRAPQEARPLRDALSQLQVAYAREAPAAPSSPPQAPRSAPPGPPQSTPTGPPPQPGATHRPGPAESSGRLWVPGR
jgi:hypothetical protein